MADKVETSLRKVEVVSNALEVIRNVYFHEKEKKDALIQECIDILEREIKELR